MQVGWIALIMLLPVKAWLHYWFPRLWPPSDQNDVRRPADLESGRVVRTEASGGSVHAALASSDQRAAQLDSLTIVKTWLCLSGRRARSIAT
ncbi:hypothetical protein Asppvi_009876 [Aspergillus pseudoviridinutans]|uniref:Uncharacterized protein n=1 Tax=Aspergillus pseudoviridinutans TaxID=1517512 RepID=A0A9P3EWK2_9EURO|nr:uncharacterized protein Asppvi_009876 [Aspergillus pseudoviridinutans]GIJ90911.1 hypothetical protein Asppvi_009876 [Aspergillus pseudoviridinutans]